MLKVEVFLKSGQTLKFQCEKCNFSYDKQTLEFTGYEFKNIKEYEKISIVPNQISAYSIR